jgi:hypothetical protein
MVEFYTFLCKECVLEIPWLDMGFLFLLVFKSLSDIWHNVIII